MERVIESTSYWTASSHTCYAKKVWRWIPGK